MGYLIVAALTAVVSVFMWEFFRHYLPYWTAHYRDDCRDKDDDAVKESWAMPVKNEYTISKDGVTRTYSSLDEMPPEDRKQFLEAERLLRDARRRLHETFQSPFFSRDRRSAPQPGPKSSKDMN